MGSQARPPLHCLSRAGWFVQCLDRIRTGVVTDMDLMVLNATSDAVADVVWLFRTQLRAKNVDVNRLNRDKLTALPGAEVGYPCRDEMNHAIRHPKRREYAAMRLSSLAPPAVTLKPGAVVLTTRAIEAVPSVTQGTVVSCTPSAIQCDFDGRRLDVPYVSFDLMENCKVRLESCSAVLLVLGWCMTIHRAQGTNLDTLAVDLRSCAGVSRVVCTQGCLSVCLWMAFLCVVCVESI